MRKFVYILLLVSLFTSCHSSKKTVSVANTKDIDMVSLYDSITSHYGDFSTVSMKFSLESKELKSLPIQQIKGSIRIKRDSAIWISVAPTLNLEVFRFLITKDSVKFYSKLQKTYYAGRLDSLMRQTGGEFDYKTIEAIFLDEIFFCLHEPVSDTLALIRTFEQNKYTFQNTSKKAFKKNSTLTLLQKWQVSNDNYRINNVTIFATDDAMNEAKIKVDYQDYEDFNAISFPTKWDVKAKMPNKKIDWDVTYFKIMFNEPLSFPFNVNSSYQKMGLKN
ncbi:MAG: DUF4292 domain-containing protein [Bacteroidales bacterium]|nr:DUF4292 domain-containing protein [Bacteroidales bacterium]